MLAARVPGTETQSQGNAVMPFMDQLYLGGSIAAFVIFAVALAYCRATSA
jgi:hypothetical protein